MSTTLNYMNILEAVKQWRPYLIALISGGIIPLSFAPLDLWPVGIIGIFGLCLALSETSAKQGFLVGWSFGVGLFGTGASWVHVSIATYGNVNGLLALLITFLFIAAMGLFLAVQCWLQQKYFPVNKQAGSPFIFAAIWALGEWFRSWFLTGFPWLYLGYAHIHSPLKPFAPIFGVYGIGFVVALTGAALFMLLKLLITKNTDNKIKLMIAAEALTLPWIIALVLTVADTQWLEEKSEEELSVGIVHGTVPQEEKFDPNLDLEIVARYEAQTAPLWGHDIIIWPETAIPMYYHRATTIIEYLSQKADENNSTLVTGIFYRNPEGLIHNSIMSMDEGNGIYHKQKLVPFGEYVPLQGIIGPVFRIFDLPMSTIRPGPGKQGTLSAGAYSLSPFICYEVVYPDFVRKSALKSDILVTISNDTWFGASWGPKQHLQMAAMRALENGRYMLRSTNNGLSAIIDEQGNILSQSTQFDSQVLSGTAKVFSGHTPYSRWGSWPVLILSFMILALSLTVGAKHSRNKQTD